MKLKKFIERLLAHKTVIVIKVLDTESGNWKKAAETPAYAAFEKYPELMSCKVLQIDPAGAEIAVIVTEPKNEVH